MEAFYISRRRLARLAYQKRWNSLSKEERAEAIYKSLSGLGKRTFTSGLPVDPVYLEYELERSEYNKAA